MTPPHTHTSHPRPLTLRQPECGQTPSDGRACHGGGPRARLLPPGAEGAQSAQALAGKFSQDLQGAHAADRLDAERVVAASQQSHADQLPASQTCGDTAIRTERRYSGQTCRNIAVRPAEIQSQTCRDTVSELPRYSGQN